MGFNKTKAVRAAEKHLAQGKIPAAIQEYRRIVEEDAEDFAALNTLGDLYSRVAQKQEAVECFRRVADHYREQGFALKAVAMFKKVTRLNPGDIVSASALGSLYEQQGLMVDARAQYLAVADAYVRTGQARELLEVLRRIADLDPNNIEIRLRLADSLVREGMDDLAADAFIDAGGRLAGRNDHHRSLEAFTSALALRPHDHAALHGLVSAHAALGTADNAVEVLAEAVAARPEDFELRAMLSRAYVAAGNAIEAERATDDLISRDPSGYTYFFDVARLHLQQGETNKAVHVLGRVVEPALAGGEEETLLALLQEMLASDPNHVGALRISARIYSGQYNDDKLRAALERLVQSAAAAGLEDEERNALVQLVRLPPYEPRFRERLTELGGDPEEAETVPVEDQYDSYDSGAVPTFESFMSGSDGFVAPSTVSSDDASIGTAAEFEWNTAETVATSPPSPPVDATSSFADLNDDYIDAANNFANVSVTAPEPQQSSASFQEIDFGAPVNPAFTTSEGEAKSADADAQATSLLKQEMESVDFYLAQGYNDIARDTLDMLERQYGTQPEINDRRRRLSSADSAAAPLTTGDVALPSAIVEGSPDFAELSRYDMTVGDAAPANSETVEEIDATFTEFVIETPEAVPAQPAGKRAAPAREAGIDPGLAAIFDEFREAVEEEEPPAEEDFETHYNLGLAYKDMDLLDESIEEFQTAAGLAASGDGTPRFLQCCNLLGHCFMQKGMPRPAAMWFKRGLEAPGQTEDEYQALRYELGIAYEQMGDLERAIDTFSEVYGIDVSYRGVSTKLRGLQAQRAANVSRES